MSDADDAEGRGVFEAIGDAMRAIPGPTEAWAEIVGHVAWPVTVLVILSRFRPEVRAAATLIVARMRTDDIAAMGFSMRKRTSVTPLAAGPAKDAGDSDAAMTERLLELGKTQEGSISLSAWVARNAPEASTVDAFLAEEAYMEKRREAVRALEQGEG